MDPDLTNEGQKKAVQQIQEVIVKNGGQVASVEEWGKRRLSYRIQRKWDGYYTLFQFQADPPLIPKIEGTYRLNDQILRHLIIKKN